MEEKLREAQIQIEELKRRKKALEVQLLLTERGKAVGKGDRMTVKPVGEKCLVLGDSLVRNVGTENSNMKFECFAGIRAVQLRRVIALILRRSRTGTVWFYTSTSNKREARPKLYTKSLTRDLKLMYSRLTLVRISINL